MKKYLGVGVTGLDGAAWDSSIGNSQGRQVFDPGLLPALYAFEKNLVNFVLLTEWF